MQEYVSLRGRGLLPLPFSFYLGDKMKAMKKVKTTPEKLNTQQKLAIVKAKQGDYLPLMVCLTGCLTAMGKAGKALHGPTFAWGERMLKHYGEIFDYLLTHIRDEQVKQSYLERLEDIGSI